MSLMEYSQASEHGKLLHSRRKRSHNVIVKGTRCDHDKGKDPVVMLMKAYDTIRAKIRLRTRLEMWLSAREQALVRADPSLLVRLLKLRVQQCTANCTLQNNGRYTTTPIQAEHEQKKTNRGDETGDCGTHTHKSRCSRHTLRHTRLAPTLKSKCPTCSHRPGSAPRAPGRDRAAPCRSLPQSSRRARCHRFPCHS